MKMSAARTPQSPGFVMFSTSLDVTFLPPFASPSLLLSGELPSSDSHSSLVIVSSSSE